MHSDQIEGDWVVCPTCKESIDVTHRNWLNENIKHLYSMDENKCCGNCKHGWTEITPGNVDEIDAIDPNRVVITTMIEGIVYSSMRADSDITLKACSELGGYYYHVLPELKIE